MVAVPTVMVLDSPAWLWLSLERFRSLMAVSNGCTYRCRGFGWFRIGTAPVGVVLKFHGGFELSRLPLRWLLTVLHGYKSC